MNSSKFIEFFTAQDSKRDSARKSTFQCIGPNAAKILLRYNDSCRVFQIRSLREILYLSKFNIIVLKNLKFSNVWLRLSIPFPSIAGHLIHSISDPRSNLFSNTIRNSNVCSWSNCASWYFQPDVWSLYYWSFDIYPENRKEIYISCLLIEI